MTTPIRLFYSRSFRSNLNYVNKRTIPNHWPFTLFKPTNGYCLSFAPENRAAHRVAPSIIILFYFFKSSLVKRQEEAVTAAAAAARTGQDRKTRSGRMSGGTEKPQDYYDTARALISGRRRPSIRNFFFLFKRKKE